MRRRIRILTDGGNAQENRALELVERFQAAGWSATVAPPETRPLIERPSVDVLWVLGPRQARHIGDGRFRLLVWERPRRELSAQEQAGALILDNCCDARWQRGGMVLDDRDCYTELDRAVKREVLEDVLVALGLPVLD